MTTNKASWDDTLVERLTGFNERWINHSDERGLAGAAMGQAADAIATLTKQLEGRDKALAGWRDGASHMPGMDCGKLAEILDVATAQDERNCYARELRARFSELTRLSSDGRLDAGNDSDKRLAGGPADCDENAPGEAVDQGGD